MNRFDDATSERLRAAFAASTDEPSPPGETCVPAERIWMAVRRELPAREITEIVLHTAECGACAEAWRLAHQVAPSAPAPDASRAAWRSPWVWAPAVAAAAVLVIGVIVDRPPQFETVPSAQYRDSSVGAVQSLVEDDKALPREEFVLRWTSSNEPNRFDIDVMTEDLRTVSAGRGLTASNYKVPPASLAKIPDGTRLLWQVVVISSAGIRTPSPTFVVRVE